MTSDPTAVRDGAPTRALAGRVRESLTGVPLVIAVVIGWDVLAILLDARHVPRVPTVARAYVETVVGAALIQDILPSVARALSGLLIAVVVGMVAGLFLGYNRALEPWTRPVLEFFRALPAPALLSAAIVLLGTTDTMRVSLIAFACLWPILLNGMDGARNVDQHMLDTGRVFGMSSMTLVRRVVLPATLPQVFAGIRTSIALAIIMMVISEFVAASHGLGSLILESQRRFLVAETYAGVLVLGTIGVLFNHYFVRIERRLIGWHHQRREGER